MRTGSAKVIIAMVGIFLAGAVVGGVASVAWIRHHSKKPNAQQVAERQMRRLVAHLELTPEQVERIRPIIREFEQKAREARRRAFVGIREIMREMNERIEAELTPEQLAVFNEMRQRERERFERYMEHRRDRRPPKDGDAPPSGKSQPATVPESSSVGEAGGK